MSGRRDVPSVVLGVALLARFRVEGFAQFTATPQAFLNSLAPFLAFPLVGGAITLLGGAAEVAIGNLLATLVALLAPAVVSHAMASLWRREALWLRYAVAFNWCQLAITLVTVVVLLLAFMTLRGVPEGEAVLLMAVLAVLVYRLVLCWFMAWRGLELSGPRAVLFVLVLNLGTAALVVGPRLLLVALR